MQVTISCPEISERDFLPLPVTKRSPDLSTSVKGLVISFHPLSAYHSIQSLLLLLSLLFLFPCRHYDHYSPYDPGTWLLAILMFTARE